MSFPVPLVPWNNQHPRPCPQKPPAREHLKLMLVGEVGPNGQTLGKVELGSAFCSRH